MEEPGQWFGWPFFEGFRRRWQFYSRDIPNPETPSDEECQEMYYFEDIMTNKRQDETYMFESPCGGTIPEEYQYIHRPPLLAWSNQEWNPPVRTNVEGYDENGVLTGLSITDPSSPVDGFTFAGGSVLTGDFNLYNQFEEEMSGKLFFGDFKGFVSVITFDENYNVVKVDPFIDEEKGMTDITFDPSSGSLYYVHLYRNELMKVTYGGTLPPTIIAEQSKEFGPSPLEVSFDATDSYSNVDGDLSYEWILPNGEIVKEEVFNYEFTSNEPQELEITLTVTDSIGQQSHESFHISINNTPPVVNITSVKDGDTYSMQRTNVVPLKAEVSDAETLTENLIFGWQVELHHDSHYHPGPTDFRQETFAFLDPVGCETEVYRYKVILTVTDEHGLSTVDSLYLNPYCGEEFSEIINLSANYHDGIVNLNWSENLPISGISHFKIEKSDDYIFREIAQLNASEKIDYFYNDNLPYIGPNIYRIKAYDHNGNYLYSNEVEINIEMLTDYFIYPNPVEDIINVIIQNEKQLETQINIIDMSGKLVRTITPTAAIQIAEQIDLSDFQSGVYYIMIANNEDRFLNRIIKL